MALVREHTHTPNESVINESDPEAIREAVYAFRLLEEGGFGRLVTGPGEGDLKFIWFEHKFQTYLRHLDGLKKDGLLTD